jgi:hypothetical protein
MAAKDYYSDINLIASRITGVPAPVNSSDAVNKLYADSLVVSNDRSSHTGTQPLSTISQSGAVSNQVPAWNGTAWVPSTPPTTPTTDLPIGRQSIWIPAGAMIARTTNGAAVGTVETATNRVMIRTLDFDTTTVEFAQFSVAMPKSWDEGAVQFQPLWSHAATTVNFGVVWQCAAVAVGNDDALDVAFGTAVLSVDTGGTTNDIYAGPESGAVTVSGSPVEMDTVLCQISRVVADAGDTMAIDARLHGVRLFYNVNAGNDTVSLDEIRATSSVYVDINNPASTYSGRVGTGTETTPAVVGGVVGNVLSKALRIGAPSDAARPILRVVGGRRQLEWDGIDDDLFATVGVIGSNCELMVATADGCYFQSGCRFVDVASIVRLPCTGSLRGYAIKAGTYSESEKIALAANFGHVSYVDAQYIASTRIVTNPTIALRTVGNVNWSANWVGGSLLAQTSSDTEQTLTMTAYRGLIVLTSVGGAGFTGVASTTNALADTLATIPPSATFLVTVGGNTITGNLSSLPSGMTRLIVGGGNTVTGDLSSLPSGMTHVEIYGSSTITGNLSSLPSGMLICAIGGTNTITGNLSSLPSGMTFISIGGLNTVTGDLSSLPSGMTRLIVGGSTNTVTFSGSTWYRTSMSRLQFGRNKSSAVVDAILIAMANTVTTSIGDKLIDLQEAGNGAPTGASASAITTLQSRGFTVQTN